MALSSDEVVKREIVDTVGSKVGIYYPRVFNEGSNDDQKLFKDGGLTFSHQGQDYGSCDCVYVFKDRNGDEIPVIAIEATDCLDRGSNGNAQYQRFHHALGAVKCGVVGVYYLRSGKSKIQPDLYGMAVNISKRYKTPYLIIQDLSIVRKILLLMARPNSSRLKSYISAYQNRCWNIYIENFNKLYSGDIKKFADKRSTIIFKKHVVKYSSRNMRNFTDSSLRGGHIAVGEMFLTKSLFPKHTVYYLWPRMTRNELKKLDDTKSNDKEWSLLRNEPKVLIKTLDDIVNLPPDMHEFFLKTRNDPLKDDFNIQWKKQSKLLHELIKSGQVRVI